MWKSSSFKCVAVPLFPAWLVGSCVTVEAIIKSQTNAVVVVVVVEDVVVVVVDKTISVEFKQLPKETTL
jgi:hypothetical protein